jgi:hypothetical protein
MVNQSFFVSLIYLILHKNDHKVKEIVSKSHGQPKKRMQHIYDLCKGKNVCEGGDEMDTTLAASQEQADDADKKIVSPTVQRELLNIKFTIFIDKNNIHLSINKNYQYF